MPWKERSLRWGGGCRMVRDTLQHYESCRATAQANGAKFFAGASGHRACSRLDARQAVATAWQVCLRARVSRGGACASTGASDRGRRAPGRGVVAEHLGVGEEELAPEVSLSDDLAVDSLDLVDLALVLEGEFGITVPEAVLEDVRTYGELVKSVEALVREREAEAEHPSRD